MSRAVTISTSEHPGPRLRPWGITLRTLVSGNAYPARRLLRNEGFDFNKRYGWWVKDEAVAQSYVTRGRYEARIERLGQDVARFGLSVRRGPHTPMRVQQQDPGVRVFY